MTTTDPCFYVIFGGTGDLSRRKLLPALARNMAEGHIGDRFRVIAVGRSAKPDDSFRGTVLESLKKAGLGEEHAGRLAERTHYHGLGEGTQSDYQGLADRLAELGKAHDIPPNHAFYMSLPPRAFGPTAAGLGSVGLNKSDGGWTRLVVEKPFGKTLATAQELNTALHEYFTEDQIYRIDHYLGKETVQNLLVFRLANAFIEANWNRDRVEAVQITVGEDLGVGTRAEYYDHAGAIRDMVQNHLTQLLTLVAMEVPTSFEANAIRNEKIKVLKSLQPLREENVIRGRYTAGEINGEKVIGYLDEQGVPADSNTETFVAFRMFVDSWRWQGVPFYMRTGKRMPHKSTQIAVRFREAPVSFFEQMGCTQDTHDILTITLQPNEGFSFYLDIKKPGSPLTLDRIPLRFHYEGYFDDSMPDAYQTLLLDVIEGDQTLFVHADEVEESWRIYTPLLEDLTPIYGYPAGSWGPPEAEGFAIPESDLWQRQKV
jgi:glucose-6-phosphate 1-dehydrogenase